MSQVLRFVISTQLTIMQELVLFWLGFTSVALAANKKK
jgi:hypothetical protein